MTAALKKIKIEMSRQSLNLKFNTMFKKEAGADEIETIIGPSVHVEGDFIAAGNVVVEGTVSGKLETEKDLRIGAGAKIFASVSANSIISAGEIQGNVRAKETIELAGTAKIFGDIKAKSMAVAPGASIQGKCQIGDERKSRPEKLEDRNKIKDKPPIDIFDKQEKIK